MKNNRKYILYADMSSIVDSRNNEPIALENFISTILHNVKELVYFLPDYS